MGNSAGVAASIAIDYNTSVQDIPIAILRSTLLKDGQVLAL